MYVKKKKDKKKSKDIGHVDSLALSVLHRGTKID